MVGCVSISMSGFRNIKTGTNVSTEIEAHFYKNNDKHNYNSKADAQGEIQPGFFLMHCKKRNRRNLSPDVKDH